MSDVSFEASRASYLIETGVAIPVRTSQSKYPWMQLAEATRENPDELPSFFVPVAPNPEKERTAEEEASVRRQSLHASGNNYYSARGMDFNAVARVMYIEGEDGTKTWGVRSWAVPVPQEAEDEESEG
jgi:superfamily II DNA/RNA helicase